MIYPFHKCFIDWCLLIYNTIQVAIAKANFAGNGLTNVIQQELILGDGNGLDNGDLVEVKYTGWLLTNSVLNPTVRQVIVTE